MRIASNFEASQVALTIRPDDRGRMGESMWRVHGGINETTKCPESEFTMQFRSPFNASSGRWEIVLFSIFLPASMHLVDPEEAGVKVLFKLAEGKRVAMPAIPEVNFSSGPKLQKYLEDTIGYIAEEQVALKANDSGRLEMTIKSGAEVLMGKKLAAILGFVDFYAEGSTETLSIRRDITAGRKVDISRTIPPRIYVRCSLINNGRMFGDKMTDTLEVIPTHHRTCAAGTLMIFYESASLNFARIMEHHITNFQISICDKNGRPLEFLESADEVIVNIKLRESK